MRASESCPLVSVVVPAFNAARTLPRTLDSVLAQTYPAVEIIVVDDGSYDDTRAIAEAISRRHANVHVISGPNRGVSHARNQGIAFSRGAFVAPLDADDLWHPTKLEKQMAAMLRGGADTALVYCAYRALDEHDVVIGNSVSFDVRGYALCQHLLVNVVGNGSSALMRKSAVLECGGYDNSLHCEDLLLQLRIAAKFRIDCVREYLVGYRRSIGRSADYERMVSGLLAVHDLVRREEPVVPARAFTWGASAALADIALSQLWQGAHRRGLRRLARCFLADPRGTSGRILIRTYDKAHAKVRAAAQSVRLERAPRSFLEYAPTEAMVTRPHYLLRRRFAAMRRVDTRLQARRVGAKE